MGTECPQLSLEMLVKHKLDLAATDGAGGAVRSIGFRVQGVGFRVSGFLLRTLCYISP